MVLEKQIMIYFLIILLVVLFLIYRYSRNRFLLKLKETQINLIKKYPIGINYDSIPSEKIEEFSKNKIISLDNFVNKQTLYAMESEAIHSMPLMVESYLPTHKKGSTLSYELIQNYAPNCLAFYCSDKMISLISQITGEKLYQTPPSDQSSLSILCYKNKGDHINWHYDHNFYKGRHFTILLSLMNESEKGLSQSKLLAVLNEKEVEIETPSNTLVVFEGKEVLHKATPLGDNEIRIMLSMTLCANPKINPLFEVMRRIKDTAFFGIKALWR